MNLNELQDIFWIQTSPNSGRPSPGMTDSQWQKKFKMMQSINIPVKKRRYGSKHASDSGFYDELRSGAYYGTTNYQNYCGFINDALSAMRHGHKTYCFYAYQIADLLRFEPLRLRTRYISEDEWWECWLIHDESKKR